MAEYKITQVMMDDQTIDASKEIAMVLSIANTLRGPYRAERYKDVIIPMIILRRLECALNVKDKNGKTSREKVLAKIKKNPKAPDQILVKESGYPFYNRCEFTLENLLTEAPAIVENLTFYIDSFSSNVQAIFEELKFKEEIKTLDKHNRLLGVVKKFSELDLNPETVDNVKMGYMFEDIIRRYSENAEAGDHYTPREVIRLLTSILLAEGCNDIFLEGKEITVLDMACGSGGMLSSCHDFIMRMNPDAKVRLFGQENNPESHAICLADMLIKNQAAENIRFADTMKTDCFEKTDMRFVIANPPFGQPWGGKDAGDGVEKAVREEHKKKKGSRFPAGLPATGDMQLLFMQHAVSKLQDGIGRAAIICNGSPLFTGNTTSGESQVRRWLLENDYVEAIIGLPSHLFYNTDIAIYAFIISKNKRDERKNKIQLIDATDIWTPLKRSLGKKRRELVRDQMKLITEVYSDFEEGKRYVWSEKRKHDCLIESRIFDKEEFLYREWAVYQPLQRRGMISEESIEALKNSSYFTSNANIFSEATFEELEQTNPRDGKAEKQYQKMLRGRAFTEAVIRELKKHICDDVYMDYSKFELKLKEILSGIEGYSASRLTGIAMAMSVIDKTAVIQKDRKKNILIDPTTKDTEIIRLNQSEKDYMEAEVLPHIPDAIYRYEYDPKKAENASNRQRLGAEFLFTKYFYEYKKPEAADILLDRFISSEKKLTEETQGLLMSTETAGKLNDMILKIEEQVEILKSYRLSLITETVTKGLRDCSELKDSGVIWIGEIPEHWDVKRIRYIIEQGANGIRVGPFGSSLKDAVVDPDQGEYKIYGQANLIRHDFEYGDNYVAEKDYLRLKNYEVLPGDILLSMMGTIGKCSTVPEGITKGIMDSHLIKMRLSDLMIPRYLEYVYEYSAVVYEQLIQNGKGSIMNGLNSTIVKNVYVPVPPIDEQKEIADYLDAKCGAIEAIIDSKELEEEVEEYAD